MAVAVKRVDLPERAGPDAKACSEIVFHAPQSGH